MTNIEYNRDKLKDNQKYKLIKVATKGLVGVGISLVILAGLKNAYGDQGFEYEQTTNEDLSTQYEEYSNKELPQEIKDALNELSSYEENFDNYEQISRVRDIDQEYLINARKDLISDVPSLIDVSHEVIRQKVISSLGLTSNANVIIESEYNSVDGPTYSLNIIDGDKHLVISKLPRIMSKMCNLEDELQRYKGNGSNKAWDKAMKEYMKTTDELYYDILTVAGKDYKFDAKEYNTRTR